MRYIKYYSIMGDNKVDRNKAPSDKVDRNKASI